MSEVQKFPESEAQLEYEDAMDEVLRLNDEQLANLNEFSLGIKTVSEIPEDIADIAIRILKLKQKYRGELIEWIQAEAERKRLKRALSISDPF